MEQLARGPVGRASSRQLRYLCATGRASAGHDGYEEHVVSTRRSTASPSAAFEAQAPTSARSSASTWTGKLSAWLGAVLLVLSSAIHLHLWFSGYRHIPTIGPLFVVQAVSGIVLAAVVAVRRSPIVLAAGALFAAGTVGALLISVNFSLFGFRDSIDAPYAKSSLVVECLATIVLAVAATVAARSRGTARSSR